MGRHPGLRARIAILVAAGAAVVAVGVGLLLSNTVNLRHTADATIRSDSYLLAVINVERLVVDAETGLRGYVITGRPLFLAPLHAAESALPQGTATLQQQAVSTHAFVAQARQSIPAPERCAWETVARRASASLEGDPQRRSRITTGSWRVAIAR
jgi:CHASE3 domain sensor protein